MSSRPATRGLAIRSQNSSTRNAPVGKKIQSENLTRPPLPNRSTTSNFLRDTTNKMLGLKRKAENSNDDNRAKKKRPAFGDITNAFEKSSIGGKKHGSQRDKLGSRDTLKTLQCKTAKPIAKDKLRKLVSGKEENSTDVARKDQLQEISFCDSLPSSLESVLSSQEGNKTETDVNKTDLDDSTAYITASEGSPIHHKLILEVKTTPKPVFPEGVDDYDTEMEKDPYAVACYVQNIFEYYKEREKLFPVSKYIDIQPDVTKSMRSILVDWMVEVQESFELNHETLYLAVKIVDIYLSKQVIKRDQLQLLGSTALFIACKFDERTPPYADDFLYICDDAYKRKELLSMEITVLKVIGFDLGIPLSYRFLRRYARCAKVSMEDLTLSRYILEMSLMDYELIDASDSALAAATLFLTRIIKGEPTWSPTLQYYSGYKLEDLYHIVHHLHNMISQPPKEHLKTIRNKYSHRVFFEVAKIQIPEQLNI
ncbi:G2/mitotic-specific cyclin-B3 [Halocaridina rubra]|uniref:G2/mitotic-specific cyclin-B3 n=1 Tax=Halocaridina rubra TaxID=373956 RepID=A0AAN8WPA4_HALRR